MEKQPTPTDTLEELLRCFRELKDGRASGAEIEKITALIGKAIEEVRS